MSIASVASALATREASLKKLYIKYETGRPGVFDGRIEALFNPAQLRYDSRAEWRLTDTGGQQSIAAGFQKMEFQATPPTTLTLELVFDTYEGVTTPGSSGLVDELTNALVPDDPFAPPTAVNVLSYTDQVADLARVNPALHRPPICNLFWGQTQLLRGVLTQLGQDFNFFLPDGTPVRATLTCSFTAYRTFDMAARDAELQSSDIIKRRVIRRGDTLSSIAGEEYDDPTRWRAIALENGIDNPRALRPGAVLIIPRIER